MMKHLFNYWSVALSLLLCIACTDVKDELVESQTNQAAVNEKGTLVELPNGTKVIKKGGQYIYEGDILLTKEQVEIIGSKSELRSTVTKDITKKWSNNIVPYTIDPSLDQYSVVTAINHWNQNTNISFIKRTTETDYVEFVRGGIGISYSSSHIGKAGGAQQITLPGSLFGEIVHEMGHAIGLWHEHTRPDRDNFITINWNNIMDGFKANFELTTLNSAYGPFDFNSIMLYDSYNFNNGKGPTMVRKDGTPFDYQRNGLSAGDITGVNSIYPANYNLSAAKTSIEVSAGGSYSIPFTSTKNNTNWQPVSITSTPSWVINPVIKQKNNSEGELSFTIPSSATNMVGEIILTQAQSNKQLKLTTGPIAAYELAIFVGSTQPNQATASFTMKIDGQTVKSRTWMPLKNSRTIIDYIPYSFPESSDVTILLTFSTIIKGFTAYGFTISSGGTGYSSIELKGKLKSINQASIGVIQL